MAENGKFSTIFHSNFANGYLKEKREAKNLGKMLSVKLSFIVQIALGECRRRDDICGGRTWGWDFHVLTFLQSLNSSDRIFS